KSGFDPSRSAVMLTHEENDFLTRVGPGTPAGQLLRRYWHAVAAAAELSAEKPKKRVRILGENLVLYREPGGKFGLVAERCSHRGASLYYGFVEDGGIRCAYHGWKYDGCGKCVEQPFENPASGFKEKIQHTAYPVQNLGGMLYAYLGPADKKPLLPKWDLLVRRDGVKKVDIELVVEDNWAGIQKQRIFAGADVPAEAPHPLIFPNILFVPVRSGYAL